MSRLLVGRGPSMLSEFGARFRKGTGAYELMVDLAVAAEQPGSIMLGGGNPARIPRAEAILRAELRYLADSDEAMPRWGGRYSAPQGDVRFREQLAGFLENRYGWPITAANVALTAGSQSAFFMLFNLFAGHSHNGQRRCVQLPLTPEYIGYSDLGLSGSLTRGVESSIEEIGDDLFKYRLDANALEIGADVGALCLSRPTNPTGNVVTEGELALIDAAARDAGIPLILDCAYGLPFPGIVFSDSRPFWNENVVLCLSLSKLGLPGLRTGIVIAHQDITTTLGAMMATMNLAPPSMGPALMERLVRTGEILALTDTVIRPHYANCVRRALELAREEFAGLRWRVHVPEGAFFLWFWFPGLRIPNWELYRRLKTRGVFVLSGHHFFPPDMQSSAHSRECIRVNYAQPAELVQRGLHAIAEEIRALG